MAHPYQIPGPERTQALETFFQHLRRDDLAAVGAAIDADPTLISGYDPNPWCCRATPLNVAASRGSREMLELLLDRGADPNQLSAWWAGGFGPLHSLDPEHEGLAELLISRGAVVDVHAAAALGREPDLKALLDHDSHLVNAAGGDGGRPLHFARNASVAQLLVDRGALIDPADVDHGSTPAQWAVGDRPDVTRLLLDAGARPDVFMLAALGDLPRLRAWLDAHPEDAVRVMTKEDFPAPGSPAGHMYAYILPGYGTAPLHAAAEAGAVEAIDCLVEAGADVSCRGGYDDQTPLHTAAHADQPHAVARLVALGADLEAPSGKEHETPPIYWAIVFGAVRAVEALIAAGASVDAGVLRCAESGVTGEFDQYSSARREDFRAIQEAVVAAAG